MLRQAQHDIEMLRQAQHDIEMLRQAQHDIEMLRQAQHDNYSIPLIVNKDKIYRPFIAL